MVQTFWQTTTYSQGPGLFGLLGSKGDVLLEKTPSTCDRVRFERSSEVMAQVPVFSGMRWEGE